MSDEKDIVRIHLKKRDWKLVSDLLYALIDAAPDFPDFMKKLRNTPGLLDCEEKEMAEAIVRFGVAVDKGVAK